MFLPAHTFYRSIVFVSTLVLLSSDALASNGMNLIAQHPRSAAIGGAGAAYLGATDALHLNPAGMVQTGRPTWSAGFNYMHADLQQIDANGKVYQDSLSRPLAPHMSFAQSSGDWAWGVGVVAQGGVGVEYAAMTPPLPKARPDTLESKIAHVRLSSAFAWRLSPQLSVGAGLNLSQLRVEMTQFPETSLSLGTQRFFGMRINDLQTWGSSLNLGMQYQTAPWFFGATYTSRSRFNLRDGRASINFSALGKGKLDYQAALEGMAWPEQLTLALGFQATSKSRLALDYQWLNWSATHDHFDLTLKSNGQPGVPPVIRQTLALNWRDQHVVKAGWEYQVNQDLGFSAGVNYARRPMKNEDVRAQFPAIAQTHLSAGLRYQEGNREWLVALEYVPPTQLSNPNPDRTVNFAGPGAQTRLQQSGIAVALTQRF